MLRDDEVKKQGDKIVAASEKAVLAGRATGMPVAMCLGRQVKKGEGVSRGIEWMAALAYL